MVKKTELPVVIENRIYEIRGKRVVLDEDLARVYQVTTKAFNQAIKRNAGKFPQDFMFKLTSQEYGVLRSQIVTLSGKTTRKYTPHAFTEHGAVMAATVLNSSIAVEASIMVVRAFIHARELIAGHADLKRRLDSLEQRLMKRLAGHDEDLREIRFILDQLVRPVEGKKRPIGFGRV